MNRDRGFSFKLLVPPRVSNGKMSAVRPQEMGESPGDFTTNSQGQTKCYNKDQNILFPNTSPVVSTKPSGQEITRIKAVPPMEQVESTCNPSQVYAKLFNEVEKIKCWKVKVDSVTLQKDRRLQDTKRTVESQRKAIQELQFVNESLSIKLEEQIFETEDLRNKNNATRNLCNVLKETFQWSAEKMQLFESEREETHQAYLENSDTIKKLMVAFESLHLQAEANKQEMQKANENLLRIQELKEKYYEECKRKDGEIGALQLKHKDKDEELQSITLDLDKTQLLCRKLQDSTDQQFELLKSSKTEQESLRRAAQTAEHRCVEIEKNRDNIAAALEQLKQEHVQNVSSKDWSLQQLNTIRDQQEKQLEELHVTVGELREALTQKTQRAEELEGELLANTEELERRNTLLKEALGKAADQVKVVQRLETELDKNANDFEFMKTKVDGTLATVAEISVELSKKTEEMEALKNEAENSRTEKDVLTKTCNDLRKDKDGLMERFAGTEFQVQKLEEELLSEKSKNKECASQIKQLTGDAQRDKVKFENILSKYNELQAESAAIQLQVEQDFSNLKALEFNVKVSKEKAAELNGEIQRLKDDNQSLREELNSNKSGIQGQYQETRRMQKGFEKTCEHLLQEIAEKEKKMKSLETKLCNFGRKIDVKLKVQEEIKKENKLLKKKVGKETAKSVQLEKVIEGLHEESQNFKELQEGNFQELLNDMKAKSNVTTELQMELEKLKSQTAAMERNRDEAELKCQQKISDMVTLMDKHKRQHEKMVEEKDAELNEMKKKKEAALAHAKSLESDLSRRTTENRGLNNRVRVETEEKEKLQKALTELKKETARPSQGKSVQSIASNQTQGRTAGTPMGPRSSKSHVFDFWNSPSHDTDGGILSIQKKPHRSENTQTSGSTSSTLKKRSKIKCYRIKTPPMSQWGRGPMELEPKSDSSDTADLLGFSIAPTSKLDFFRKLKSPAVDESTRTSSKVAAMKRMRDAGWTAVVGSEKKKKTTTTAEKIFA